MQAVSRQNIDKWLRENEYTYGNLAVKRENKSKQPKQAVKIPGISRQPLRLV